MPSPFPGMDPFLENPEIFPDLHDRLINGISDAINLQLRPPYYSAIASRVFVEHSDRIISPDVSVILESDKSSQDDRGSTTAVLTAIEVEPIIIHVPHDEIREQFLEIRTAGDERLVTSIEVLSASNKSRGEHGRELYKKKQREILASDVHLVEIDLLRGGEHTTAVPLIRAERKTGKFNYHVCVHRFDQLENYVVYPITLRSRLPKIAIPLLPGDPDIAIDLQHIFDHCYEAGLYRRRIRYEESLPVPPLAEIDVLWSNELFARK